MLHPADVLTDRPSLKANELTKRVREKYNAMSVEERIEFTKDAVKELQENREMAKYAEHSVPLAAWRDYQVTMARVQELVSLLDHQSRCQL